MADEVIQTETPDVNPFERPASEPVQPAEPATPVADPNTPVVEEPEPFADQLLPEENIADPLEALKDNPRVQELLQAESQVKAFQDTLKDLPYQVSSPEDLKLQLTDAHMLYDIVQGKTSASQLLTTMLNNPEWTEQQKQAVVADLAGTLQQYTKTPIAAAAAGQPTQSPEALRLAAVEKELNDRKQAEAQTQLNQRIQDGRTKINARLKEFIGDRVPDSFIPRYAKEIGQHLGGRTEEVLNALDKGDFKLIEQAATKVHNAWVKEHAEFTKWLAGKKQNSLQGIPLQAGSGTPTGTAEPQLEGDAARQARIRAGAAAMRG